MNINDLTIGQAKELITLFQNNIKTEQVSELNYSFVGKKVIIRTYSAGVFFGEVMEKVGNEVILKNARRLYYWKTLNKGLSLSEVANLGLDSSSKVCAPTTIHWLQPIEIIICSDSAIKNIEGQNEFTA